MNKTQAIIKRASQIAHVDERIRDALQTGPLRVEWKPHKKSRSLSQNSLYWFWLTTIRDHVRDTIGQTYTTDEIHELFKDMFLPKVSFKFRDRLIIRPKSTRELNVQQFTDYLNDIEMYCADRLHLILPHPDEYGEAMGK